MHATRDLDVTLRNLRKMMKPYEYPLAIVVIRLAADFGSGGKIILFEITKPDKLRAGFVFGLLPGWWLGM